MESAAADKADQFNRLAFRKRGLRKVLPLDNLPVNLRHDRGLVDLQMIEQFGHIARPGGLVKLSFGSIDFQSSIHRAPLEETGTL